MKRFILSLLLFCTSAWAEVQKPYASIFFYQDNAQNLITETALTIFDNGNLHFYTNNGGWGLCSGSKAGRFTGKLSPEAFLDFKKNLAELSGKCSKLEGCSLKREGGLGEPQYNLKIQGKSIQNLYLKEKLFLSLFTAFADKNFINGLKALEAFSVNVENQKIYFQALNEGKFLVQLQKNILAYNQEGVPDFIAVKDKKFNFTQKSVALKLKKAFTKGSRLVLSFDLSSKDKMTKHYALCLFDK